MKQKPQLSRTVAIGHSTRFTRPVSSYYYSLLPVLMAKKAGVPIGLFAELRGL
jgi:hypothetical protein